jgi:ANTAR domain/GAF domain
MLEHCAKQAVEGRERRIAAAFVELADTLAEGFDIVDYLGVLAALCVELLPVTAAGVLLADHKGHLRAMAASAEAAQLLELLELQNEEGPGLSCFRSGALIANASLDPAATQWPAFAARARSSGYAVTHALPLRLRHTVVGVLNLFAGVPDPLACPDLDLVQSMAEAATIGILHQRALVRGVETTVQLQHALNSRIVIEQAKGVLAERMQIPVDDAFIVLRAHARSHNLRLSTVAQSVAEGGDLADPHSGPASAGTGR